MTSVLISALARMHRGADYRHFALAHHHCWIVWEPGAWKPPTKSGETVTSVQLATPPPANGEALALALTVRPGRPAQLTLGRSTTSDIEINDATLSQVHLLFMQGAPGQWTVRDAGSKNGSWLDGQPLNRGEPKALANGARIQAAQVCLTFYEPQGLFTRLTAHPGYTPVPSMQPMT
jgi:hypothetical protein